MEYCVRCGCKLDSTTWGYKFCMNCGKLPENNQKEIENEKEETPSYVG